MVDSFPISGVVYNERASLEGAGIKVFAYNQTNKEYTSCTTNASGEYTLDLANMTTAYAVNDRIWVYAVKEGFNATMTAIITTGDAFWENNLYFKSGDLMADTSTNSVPQAIRLVSAVGFTSATARSFCFVEKKTGVQKLVVNVPVNTTVNAMIYKGQALLFQEGFWCFSCANANNINSQSVGVTNALGDTSTTVGFGIAYNTS